MKVLIQKSIKITLLAILLTSLFVLMINLVNRLFFLELKRLLMNLLRQFLKSISIILGSEKTFQQKFDHE